jgi:hypothetical protein
MGRAWSALKATMKKIKSRIAELLMLLIPISMLVVCVMCGTCIFVASLAEPLTRSMMPPDYPNSQLSVQSKSSGSGGFGEVYYYRTSDTVLTVQQWYKTYVPSFVPIAAENGKIELYNSLEDSLVSYVVGYMNSGEWGNRPGVSIRIMHDPQNPAITHVYIANYWPSL